MRFKFVCVLLGVGCGILGAGCRTTGGPRVPAPSHEPLLVSAGPKEAVIDPTNGYMSNRWIGLRSSSSGGCPKVKGWKGEPLLSQGASPVAADRTLIRELGLDRFCVYTPKAGSSRPFVAPPGLTAARDRLSISSSSADVVAGSLLTSKSNAVEAALALEFLSQTGHLSSPLPGPPNVQITFVDSQPDGDIPTEPPQGSQHGFTVAHLAQELVCTGSCAATISAKRALNFDDPDQTTIPLGDHTGGTIGTITDLGNAIIAAVRERAPGKNLILNLSIGWDGETLLDGRGTDLDVHTISELETSVQFVYRALQFATRKGALVIAAAGNRRGGSLKDTNWPTLPAAWELQHPSWSYFDPPLIYAVGGVDWQGLPLSNSRTNGLPVRVAYGDHATVFVKGPYRAAYTTAYTGTSVSTAVVSAAAAMIWHLHPHLRPAEVMRMIDSSGEVQDARADFYRGSNSLSPSAAPQIREISLCAAVKAACGANGQSCSAGVGPALQCGSLSHQPPQLSSLLAQPDSGVPFHPTAFPPPLTPPCYPGTLLLTTNDKPSQPICPTDQYSSLSAFPWVLPQPGDDPCPNCTLVPTGPPAGKALASEFIGSSAFAYLSTGKPVPQFYQLAISLSPSWLTAHQGSMFGSAAMLDVDCFDTSGAMTRTTYPVDITPSTNPTAPDQQAWTVFHLGDGNPLNLCRAQLNFVVKDESGKEWSVQNPVVVDPDYVNPVGSDKSIVVPSKVGTVGEKERIEAAAPPF